MESNVLLEEWKGTPRPDQLLICKTQSLKVLTLMIILLSGKEPERALSNGSVQGHRQNNLQ